MNENTIAVRSRNEGDLGAMNLDDFIQKLGRNPRKNK
jgi:threonyl-tRNA synthetase